MKRYLSMVATALFASIQTSAYSADRPVDTKLCRDIAVRIVDGTGASFVKFTSDGGAVIFQHPLADSLTLSCEFRIFTKADIQIDSPFPSPLWFYLAAEVGNAVSGVPVDGMERAITHCHHAALAEKIGISSEVVGDAKIECAAGTQQGFSLVTIVLYDMENRKQLGEE